MTAKLSCVPFLTRLNDCSACVESSYAQHLLQSGVATAPTLHCRIWNRRRRCNGRCVDALPPLSTQIMQRRQICYICAFSASCSRCVRCMLLTTLPLPYDLTFQTQVFPEEGGDITAEFFEAPETNTVRRKLEKAKVCWAVVHPGHHCKILPDDDLPPWVQRAVPF